MLSCFDVLCYLLGIHEMSVQGFVKFFIYNIKNGFVSHHKVYNRISDLSGNQKDTTCIFIDKFNLQSMSSYHFIGHLVAVKDVIWRIGMIPLMNYNIVSVVFLRNGLFFRKMNDDISLSTILTEYFSAPKYYSCHKFSQLSVCYLNNLTSGKVNKSVYDNKFICDERGPDLLLRKEVFSRITYIF